MHAASAANVALSHEPSSAHFAFALPCPALPCLEPSDSRLALQLGYRHIDCATAYGNHEDVGKGFARAFKEGLVKREDLWIT